MKILIEDNILKAINNNCEVQKFEYLLNIVINNACYELIIKDITEDCFLLQNLSGNDRILIQEVVASSVNKNIDKNSICIVSIQGDNITKERIFTMNEAIIYLQQPASIILENSTNDSYFVKAVIRCFGNDCLSLKYLKNNWIDFVNAGGCGNVENFIKGRLNKFDNKSKFLRLCVILDGDKKFDSDTDPDIKYKRLVTFLKTNEIPYHILSKRCSENYLPIDALNSISDKEWLNAYKYLTPYQRDYYDISHGFTKDIPKEDIEKAKIEELHSAIEHKKQSNVSYIRKYQPAKIHAFYSDVSDGNFKHLENGLKIANFKEEFPKFFDGYCVNKIRMIQMTQHQKDPDELNKIIKMIYSIT